MAVSIADTKGVNSLLSTEQYMWACCADGGSSLINNCSLNNNS